MAVLRSTQLGAYVSAGAPIIHPFFTVPAGYRAVLRDIRIAEQSGATSPDLTIILVLSGGSGSVWLFRETLAATQVASLSCDVVLNQGDALELASNTNGVAVVASGALLTVPS